MFARLKERIREWYHGPFETFDSAHIIGGFHNPHWTARIVRTLVEFWLEHWKWIITTVLAIIALVIAAKKIG